MYEDSVLKELHQAKDRIAAKYDYDVRKLVRALRRKQKKARLKSVRSGAELRVVQRGPSLRRTRGDAKHT